MGYNIIPADKVVGYFHAIIVYRKNNPDIRNGQAFMIVLHDMFPDIYNRVTGTEYDCFYNDAKIFNLMAEIC